MEHYGAYDFQKCLEESSLVLSGLYLRVPGIHHKRVWPTVQLMAFYGNSQGGRSKGKKLDEARVFRLTDFLPGWAVPQELREQMQTDLRLDAHHCWAFQLALENGELKNASWVLQVVALKDDLERIEQVAEMYDALPVSEAQ